MAKKWSWKLAYLKLIYSFGSSFFTPLLGANIILDPTFAESILIGLISSGIFTGVVFFQIIDKYIKFIGNNNGTSV